MRRACSAFATLALTALAATLIAQEPRRDGVEPPAQFGPAADRDREAAALEFVRTHHDELSELLGTLRMRDRVEYDSAIRELARNRENLERIRRRDPDRAALALAGWKANSRVELIAARLISKPDPMLERDLRRALADQLAAQLAMQKYDRAQLQKRLEQIDETISRLDRRGGAMVEMRLKATMKKVQRVRRQANDGDEADPADLPNVSARPEGEKP